MNLSEKGLLSPTLSSKGGEGELRALAEFIDAMRERSSGWFLPERKDAESAKVRREMAPSDF